MDTGLTEIDWEFYQLKNVIVWIDDKVSILSTIEKINTKE